MLRAARREHEQEAVTRVLLLGDAPPHLEANGERLPGHDYLLRTDYRREAHLLSQLGVPVYTFHLGTWRCRHHIYSELIRTFSEIAETTGGSAAELDSPAKLLDVVCKSALVEIGGSELVEKYQEMYAS